MMEDSGSGVEEEYWVSHEYGSGPVVEKGLTLGKRLLITGFVVTSAPVVVPPFLVISALGFACSIPYVLFLATYSFTEILMPKLLPLPPQDHQFVDPNNGYEEDDQVYMNKGREELLMRRDEDHEMEAIKEEKEEQVVDEGLEVCAVSVVVSVTEEGDGLGSAVEPIEARSTVVVEVFEDGEENEEFAEQTTGLLRRIRDEGLAEDDDEQPLKEKEIPAQEPTNHHMSVDDKTTDASIEHLENGNAGNTEDAAFLQTAEVDGDATDNKNGASVHASTKVQKKVVEEEETIREQINTLRAIVGYSGTGQMTCMEELKALYVFTGVVPPQVATSLSDADDLAEVYGKLQNLKLIVGVK